MNDPAPALSAGYIDETARMIRARQKQNEDRIFDDFIKDHAWFPTDPDRATTIRQMARKAILALMRPALT